MKQRLLDALCWLGIALCCTFLSLALAYPAIAQEVGQGLICDTVEQVEIFSAYADASTPQEALAEVGTVCGIAKVAFIRGEEKKALPVKHGTAHIVEIAVIAVEVGGGMQRVPPNIQYTIFLTKSEGI